ncbi:MAG TPA: hypothetical protein VFQ60_02965 [Patescibacteria group bacterium]|nr:hypothetical protein [Patescibacteria group bacterium]
MDEISSGLVRTLSFFDAYDYPPTRAELFYTWDRGADNGRAVTQNDLATGFVRLETDGIIAETRGRITFSGRTALVADHEKRAALFPFKIRQARRIVRWLVRLSGVRFVALCNTTALEHAKAPGDLDFFIIAKRGSLWQTRFFSVLPFKFFNRRPRAGQEMNTACFSFFIDDEQLDLSGLQLAGDDVYFRHWFLSLLPLYDDGISVSFWEANQSLLARHPMALPWIPSHDLCVPQAHLRIPMLSSLERIAKRIQTRYFPESIRALMNQDTRVQVNDHVLKFHVNDGREAYRSRYYERCTDHAVSP